MGLPDGLIPCIQLPGERAGGNRCTGEAASASHSTEVGCPGQTGALPRSFLANLGAVEHQVGPVPGLLRHPGAGGGQGGQQPARQRPPFPIGGVPLMHPDLYAKDRSPKLETNKCVNHMFWA